MQQIQGFCPLENLIGLFYHTLPFKLLFFYFLCSIMFLAHDRQYQRFPILLQLLYRCASCLAQSYKTGDHQPSHQIYKHHHL